MPVWEYRIIRLNEAPPRRDALHLLNLAGEEGWELVEITSKNLAYLKRRVQEESEHLEHDADAPLHEVKAKYRDPATGATWSGRGRMASWLKKKQDAGEDIEKYRV